MDPALINTEKKLEIVGRIHFPSARETEAQEDQGKYAEATFSQSPLNATGLAYRPAGAEWLSLPSAVNSPPMLKCHSEKGNVCHQDQCFLAWI